MDGYRPSTEKERRIEEQIRNERRLARYRVKTGPMGQAAITVARGMGYSQVFLGVDLNELGRPVRLRVHAPRIPRL